MPGAGAVHKFGPLLETLLSCRVVADPDSPNDLVLTTDKKCQRISPLVFAPPQPQPQQPQPPQPAVREEAEAAQTMHKMVHVQKRLQKPWVWETVVRSVRALAEGQCSCKSLC